MALPSDLKGLKFEIRVDGKALAQYDGPDEEIDHNTVTKYIEAVSGQQFTIHVVHERGKGAPQAEYVIQCLVDGTVACARIRQPTNWATSPSFDCLGLESIDGRLCKVYPLHFKPIETTDSQIYRADATLASRLKSLGVLSIRFLRGKTGKDLEGTSANKRKLENNGPIAEKALKGAAVTHGVATGKNPTTKPYNTSEFQYKDSFERPFARFDFRYRSLQALKAEGVIPRSPSPVPLEERDIDALTPEEMRELLKRQKVNNVHAPPATKQEREQIKSESGTARSSKYGKKRGRKNGDDDEAVFVSERPSKAARRDPSADDEVIFLD